MMNVHEQRMCEMQGELFALSSIRFNCGSSYFIARFMNSELSGDLDKIDDPYNFTSPNNIISYMKDKYPSLDKKTDNKYPESVLKWMGSVYRAYVIIKKISSYKLYKQLKSDFLLSLYDSYHSFSLDYCVERISELLNENKETVDPYLLYKSVVLKDNKKTA